jgi:hypothetical protein
VVDRLERSVEAMDRLFGTILGLSKLDNGGVKPSNRHSPDERPDPSTLKQHYSGIGREV